MPDEMKIEILPDGTIKVDTGPVSAANHSTAEALLRNLQSASGGGTQTRKHKAGVLGAIHHAWQHATGKKH
jgi:hypothetical protein